MELRISNGSPCQCGHFCATKVVRTHWRKYSPLLSAKLFCHPHKWTHNRAPYSDLANTSDNSVFFPKLFWLYLLCNRSQDTECHWHWSCHESHGCWCHHYWNADIAWKDHNWTNLKFSKKLAWILLGLQLRDVSAEIQEVTLDPSVRWHQALLYYCKAQNTSVGANNGHQSKDMVRSD